MLPKEWKPLCRIAGRAREVLTQLVGGLQSGMSYSGAHSIEEFQDKAIFVRMTGAGLKSQVRMMWKFDVAPIFLAANFTN